MDHSGYILLLKSLHCKSSEEDLATLERSFPMSKSDDLINVRFLKSLVPYMTTRNGLKNLIHLFVRHVSVVLDEILKHVERSNEALGIVKDFWALCFSQKQMFSYKVQPDHHTDIVDVLPSLASIFIDLYISVHCTKGKLHKVSRQLFGWLTFELNERCVKTALLEVTLCSERGAQILMPLLRHFLLKPVESRNPLDYLLHTVLLRRWCLVCDQLNHDSEKLSSVKAPPRFVEWLSQRWARSTDHFPLDKSLKGHKVTDVMMSLDKVAVEELIDVFSRCLWSTQESGAAAEEVNTIGVAMEMEQTGQLFVIDKKGTKKSYNKSSPKKRQRLSSHDSVLRETLTNSDGPRGKSRRSLSSVETDQQENDGMEDDSGNELGDIDNNMDEESFNDLLAVDKEGNLEPGVVDNTSLMKKRKNCFIDLSNSETEADDDLNENIDDDENQGEESVQNGEDVVLANSGEDEESHSTDDQNKNDQKGEDAVLTNNEEDKESHSTDDEEDKESHSTDDEDKESHSTHDEEDDENSDEAHSRDSQPNNAVMTASGDISTIYKYKCKTKSLTRMGSQEALTPEFSFFIDRSATSPKQVEKNTSLTKASRIDILDGMEVAIFDATLGEELLQTESTTSRKGKRNNSVSILDVDQMQNGGERIEVVSKIGEKLKELRSSATRAETAPHLSAGHVNEIRTTANNVLCNENKKLSTPKKKPTVLNDWLIRPPDNGKQNSSQKKTGSSNDDAELTSEGTAKGQSLTHHKSATDYFYKKEIPVLTPKSTLKRRMSSEKLPSSPTNEQLPSSPAMLETSVKKSPGCQVTNESVPSPTKYMILGKTTPRAEMATLGKEVVTPGKEMATPGKEMTGQRDKSPHKSVKSPETLSVQNLQLLHDGMEMNRDKQLKTVASSRVSKSKVSRSPKRTYYLRHSQAAITGASANNEARSVEYEETDSFTSIKSKDLTKSKPPGSLMKSPVNRRKSLRSASKAS